MKLFRFARFTVLLATLLLSNFAFSQQNDLKMILIEKDIFGEVKTTLHPVVDLFSNNQLSFTIDAGNQANAVGTYSVILTHPNGNFTFLKGLIGNLDKPLNVQIGPPSHLGSYSITFLIDALTGTLDPEQGPFVTFKNLTNNDELTAHFKVENVGDQDIKSFINRP